MSRLFLSFIIFVSLGRLDAASITLTERQLCDLEMLMVRGFSPLDGFMNEVDYNSVVENMRLANGTVWPIPIVLDVDHSFADQIEPNEEVELKDSNGTLLATLQVSEAWSPDKLKEAQHVYGTTDKAHYGVKYLLEETHDTYLSGPLTHIQSPAHFNFKKFRLTPDELKAHFKEHGIDKVVGFQTRNPMHRAHITIAEMAAEKTGAHLLIHPIVGKTKTGDINPCTRMRCYKKALKYLPKNRTSLAALPLAMRMAGPKEALWHAIIRKNYGCTHFIVGRDHAGPGSDSQGNPFYGVYEAQELVKKHSDEIGIELVSLPEIVYVKELDNYIPSTELTPEMNVLKISGTEIRRRLRFGEEIPSFFSYPEIVQELRADNPPLSKQGITLFLTGLSGAGKSTLANALNQKLSEIQNRKITLLDGDVIRENLSPKLGFTAEDRSLNVRRVGFVANEITKNGGIAICSMIAPYEKDRELVRNMVSGSGKFVEIHLSTPLSECERRDVKGLYARVRKGEIKQFTGIDDPYEPPITPELRLDTTDLSIETAMNEVVIYLKKEGYLTSE